MAEAGEEPAEPLRPREAVPEDAATIVAWLPTHRDAVWWGGPTVPDPLTAQWLAAQFTLAPFWVWTDQNDVVQAVAGLRAEGGTTYLNRFGMAPAMRGRGLSAKLMTDMIEIARARGDTAMSLWVYGANTTARRVYDRWGFRTIGQREAAEDASGVSFNIRLELSQISALRTGTAAARRRRRPT